MNSFHGTAPAQIARHIGGMASFESKFHATSASEHITPQAFAVDPEAIIARHLKSQEDIHAIQDLRQHIRLPAHGLLEPEFHEGEKKETHRVSPLLSKPAIPSLAH